MDDRTNGDWLWMHGSAYSAGPVTISATSRADPHSALHGKMEPSRKEETGLPRHQLSLRYVQTYMLTSAEHMVRSAMEHLANHDPRVLESGPLMVHYMKHSEFKLM